MDITHAGRAFSALYRGVAYYGTGTAALTGTGNGRYDSGIFVSNDSAAATSGTSGDTARRVFLPIEVVFAGHPTRSTTSGSGPTMDATTEGAWCCWDAALWNASGDGNASWLTRDEAEDGGVALWARDITLGLVLALLSLLTFVGNAMVLHAVRTDRRLQSVSNMFIVSLAIADLIVGLVVMPVSATYIFTETWPFGVAVCQFWIGVDYTASTASILNLFILSLDRYWSVTTPLKYLRKRTKRRALVMISLVWGASVLWLIPIVGWHHFEHGGVRTVPDDVCDTEYATNTVLKIITAILNYYLPLAVMFGLYTKIFIEIRRRSKLELGQRSGCGSPDGYAYTASLSDDSEERILQPSDSLIRNNSSGYLTNHHMGMGNGGSVGAARRAVPYNCLSVRREQAEADTETDLTDDEMSRLSKEGSVRRPLVQRGSSRRSHSPLAPPPNVCCSDTELNRSPATVPLVREHFGNNQFHPYEMFPMSPMNGGRRSTSCYENVTSAYVPDVVAETEVAPGSPRVAPYGTSQGEDEGRVRFDLATQHSNSNKSPLLLPKEHHPAKNQCVRKPLRSSLRSESREPGGGDGGAAPTSPGAPHRSRTPSPRPLRSPAPGPASRRTDSAGSAGSRRHGPPGGLHPSPGGLHPSPGSLHSPNNSALVKQAVRWKRKIDRQKQRPSTALHKEIKAARQLGVIMGAFTVCFFPYFVCFMVVAFCDDCIDSQLMTAVTWVGYLNSTLNPLLYPLCNANFRRKFRQMLRLSGSSAEERKRKASFYAHHMRNMSDKQRQSHTYEL